jgi:hypothetical protein
MHIKTIVASVLIVGSVALLTQTILSRSAGTAPELAARAGATSPSVRFEGSILGAAAEAAGNPANAMSSPATSNLSDLLAHDYLIQVGQKNSLGLSADAMKLPSQDILQSLIDGVSTGSVGFIPFTERDVRVGKDASVAAERAYLESLDRTLNAHFENTGKKIPDALNELSSKGGTSAFELLASLAEGYIGDVLAIQPPPALLSTHIAWLNLWREKSAVYQAIVQYESDPLRAGLALKELSSIVQKDVDLQMALIARYNALPK